LLKPAAVFADRQQGERPVEMRMGKILLRCDRLGVTLERIMVPAGGLQRLAAGAQRLGMIRRERKQAQPAIASS
jgi:hypothetical protein